MTGLPGHDSGIRRALDKVAWGRAVVTGQLGQDSLDMTDRSGEDISDRISGTRQLGQDSQDRSDWTSQPDR